MQKIGRLLGWTALLGLGTVLLFCPSVAASGVSEGMRRCETLLIPSLFPTFFFSAYWIRSGGAEGFGSLLGGFMRRWFRLPECAAAVLLTGLLGGYPTGARGIRTLYENGRLTEEQARRMMLFCVGAGPGFTVSAVGAKLLGDPLWGLCLLAAQILSALLLGILLGRFAPKPQQVPSPHPQKEANAFVNAVADAANGLCSLCAFVLLFCAVQALAEHLGIFALFSRFLAECGVPIYLADTVLPMLCEVSGGVAAAAFSPILLAFTLGWGGFCVHLQIFSAIGTLSFSRPLFFAFRLAQGVLSALFTALIRHFLPAKAVSAVTLFGRYEAQTQASAPLFAALLLLCAVFLISVRAEAASIVRPFAQNGGFARFRKKI